MYGYITRSHGDDVGGDLQVPDERIIPSWGHNKPGRPVLNGRLLEGLPIGNHL